MQSLHISNRAMAGPDDAARRPLPPASSAASRLALSNISRHPETPTRVRTLIIDDDALVRDTFTAILSDEGYEVMAAASGREALECLARQEADIVLCDIFMPDQTGFEVLSLILASFPHIPVIMSTGNGSVAMAREAVNLGASDFVTKPCNQGELPIVVERNLSRQAVALKNTMRHNLALQISNESILDALLTALNTRDTETQGHSERVTAYTIEMADRLSLSDTEKFSIERGALLHDIGKIGVPDRILHKPGKLTEDEWIEMRKHPLIGYRMCNRINMLHAASEIVLHHHESWNGSGYPDGLAGDKIPLGARVFAVADTLDAMTSDRPYRQGLPFSVARDEIERHSGIQFDPEIVKLFCDVSEARWRQIRALVEQSP